ncbi:hypothetical protein HMPREF3232_00234 [Fannyhessea vaginae]|nr:hypothetical protein HMPREF3232_00234 [Fannyhessea vaginae]
MHWHCNSIALTPAFTLIRNIKSQIAFKNHVKPSYSHRILNLLTFNLAQPLLYKGKLCLSAHVCA